MRAPAQGRGNAGGCDRGAGENPDKTINWETPPIKLSTELSTIGSAEQDVPSLTALHLDGNRAGVRGARALAAALRNGSGGAAGLRTLGLSMNTIGDEGGVALGEVSKNGLFEPFLYHK